MHQSGAKAVNDIQLAKYLGWFSLTLGAFEMSAAGRIAAALGLSDGRLVRGFGAREVAAGLMVLTQPDAATPVWGRVAGDAMDAAVLAMALGSGNRQRHNAAWAMIFVVAATALDVGVATALTRRARRAHVTAKRTRVAAKGAK